MLAPQTTSTSRSSGPRSSVVIGGCSRPHDRRPPSSRARIGPPNTSRSGVWAAPRSIAANHPGGASTSSSMSTIRSPAAAVRPALRAALAPEAGARSSRAPWSRATRAFSASTPSSTTSTSTSAVRACGITEASVTPRYSGRSRVGITIDAVGWLATRSFCPASAAETGAGLVGWVCVAGPQRASMGDELASEVTHEARVVPRVAPPQAPWLVRQPVGPFEAQLLHPRRGLGNESGVEVERGADADQYRRTQLAAQLRHPLLLLGHPDADPHDVGARGVDLMDDLGPLVCRQRTVWRRVATDDPDSRIALAQV